MERLVIASPLRWLDGNLERIVMLVAYVACAAIIAVEVARRYLFSVQAPWSTTIPTYMFLWLTWIGAAYAVKARLHLNFGEIRGRLSRRAQYWLMQIDYLMYLLFGAIVIYWSYDLLLLQIDNDAIVPGTDNAKAWWFYSATPAGWSLLLLRVCQKAIEDWRDYVAGRPLQVRGSLADIG